MSMILLLELFNRLHSHFGSLSDPDVWWPIYYGACHPREFERTITNILVQNSSWRPVRTAVDVLHRHSLLTASSLSGADEGTIADCVRTTGLQKQKAKRLKSIGSFVMDRFGSEQAFCDNVTRKELLEIPGIGSETSDRILLYTCARFCFPVDTYSLRVLFAYGVIAEQPDSIAARKIMATEIKAMVESQLPRKIDEWQRLHALFQLEGERLRREKNVLLGA